MAKAKKDRGGAHQALIIFIKNPELGKVKTRLAQDVGDEQALEIYKRLLAHTRRITSDVSVGRFLFYYESIRDDDWPEDLFEKHLQPSGDLGAKMNTAFKIALESCQQAIIIGSDCAQLSSDVISSAFKALSYHDIVIGPTYDGGYYLLGMNDVHPELFEDMTWSVSTVYEETIKRAESLGLVIAKLETLSDIDHMKDWQQYGLK